VERAVRARGRAPPEEGYSGEGVRLWRVRRHATFSLHFHRQVRTRRSARGVMDCPTGIAPVSPHGASTSVLWAARAAPSASEAEARYFRDMNMLLSSLCTGLSWPGCSKFPGLAKQLGITDLDRLRRPVRGPPLELGRQDLVWSFGSSVGSYTCITFPAAFVRLESKPRNSTASSVSSLPCPE
jgi:hypothetical protein